MSGAPQRGADAPAPAEADWAELVAALHAASSPVLVAHVAPDGDALGSALGVALALRSLGSTPRVTFGETPALTPRALRFLPGQELIVDPGTVEAAPEVIVAFDTSSAARLGELADRFEAAPASFAVDHHASYTGFAATGLVDVASPATAVLALELVDRLGAELTAPVATCLYTGLTTDTGSFRYAGTTPATHAVAARLLATGIRHDEIARAVWDTTPFGYLAVLGAALSRAVLEPAAADGLGLVWTCVPAADRAAHGVELDTVEGVVDVVRRAEEAEVACVLKQEDPGPGGEPGRWRVSLRSKGAVDVSRAAVALGGGGHRYAAGFEASGEPGAIVRAVLDRLVGGPSAADEAADEGVA
ncbi:MAG: DHH family phosphoesterase [Motilibacteraceae bacterium]